MRTHAHTHTHTHTIMHTYTHTHTHKHAYTHTHTRTGPQASCVLQTAHARLLPLQSRVLQYPLFISFWNVFYGTAHMAVTVFVLSYLFILKPSAYQRSRTVFMVMNMIALAGYACYPLMPPRLLNDCIDPYGGCLKDPELNFVDTMEEYGGLWSWRSKGLTKVSNHYAAMPSMHAGYSTWCSTSILKHSQVSVTCSSSRLLM